MSGIQGSPHHPSSLLIPNQGQELLRKKSATASLPTFLYINMGDQLSLQLAPVTRRTHQPRGINAVELLFKKHFQSFADQYEANHAIIYGRFRIGRITDVVIDAR